MNKLIAGTLFCFQSQQVLIMFFHLLTKKAIYMNTKLKNLILIAVKIE
jgi:hypothetical protein